MKSYNYIYSLFCHNRSVGRSTDAPKHAITGRLQEIIKTLIPDEYANDQRSYLAELYIKFIQTDSSLNNRLHRIDPYNSYDIEFFNIMPEQAVDISKIAKAVKELQITTVRYTDPLNYIILGLDYLLKLCEDLNV